MSVATWADLVANKPTTGDWVAAGTWQGILQSTPGGTGAIFVSSSESTSGHKDTGGMGAITQAPLPPMSSGHKGGVGSGSAAQGVLSVTSLGERIPGGSAVLSVESFVGIYTNGIGSGRLALTSSLFTRGGKDTRGNGLLYVADTPTIVGHKQQWYFAPPTRRVYGHGDRFWRRVHIDQGVTVIRKGEVFIVTETPSAEDFEEADRVYVGGYVYPIDDEERLALQAAGYDPFPEDIPAQTPSI